MAILIGLLFGFLQGLRHAFEPDHVVAISTMMGEATTARRRVAYAAAWGVGHATMLLARWGLPALLGATGIVSLTLGLAWFEPAPFGCSQ